MWPCDAQLAQPKISPVVEIQVSVTSNAVQNIPNWLRKNSTERQSASAKGAMVCAKPNGRAEPVQAARRAVSRVHTSASAATSASISASLCNGDGVRRRRSVPRGTVG